MIVRSDVFITFANVKRLLIKYLNHEKIYSVSCVFVLSFTTSCAEPVRVGFSQWRAERDVYKRQVLADAITKGIFSNVDEALDAMVSTSTVPYYEGVADYMKLGYIPLDKSGTAASSTLEYAYDDLSLIHILSPNVL